MRQCNRGGLWWVAFLLSSCSDDRPSFEDRPVSSASNYLQTSAAPTVTASDSSSVSGSSVSGSSADQGRSGDSGFDGTGGSGKNSVGVAPNTVGSTSVGASGELGPGAVPTVVATTSGSSPSTTLAADPNASMLGLGEPCVDASQCLSNACQPTWSEQASTSVCCASACADDERCGTTGSCQSCAAGVMEDCWETEAGEPLPGTFEGLTGACHVGKRTCSVDGAWGACIGAIAPAAADSCGTPGADEDCDGKPNENCTCVAETMRACGSDVGNCVAGVQTCENGTWSECVGEVAKQTQDSCEVEGDDADCNDVKNEGCKCIGAATQACGTCGKQTCNPSARDWGACAKGDVPAQCRAGSNTVLETCSAQGEWQPSTCPLVCTNNACGGQCSPGTARCDNNVRQTCDGGEWNTVENCATGSQCVNNGAECRKVNGGACSNDNQCVSNACVDGICCQSECPAVSCSSMNTECSSFPTSVTTGLCDSGGQCRTSAAVCAEHVDVESEGTACEFPNVAGGQCNGAGECVAPSVTCGNSSCSLDERICCVTSWNWGTAQCTEDTSEACPHNTSQDLGFRIECDEDTDCGAGNQCCYVVTSSYRGTVCEEGACPGAIPNAGSAWHLCRSPAGTQPCRGGENCEEESITGFAACVEPDE